MQNLDIPHGRMVVNGFEVRFMPPEALHIHRSLKFIDAQGILALLQQLAYDPSGEFDPSNYLLKGPKGTGKTLLFLSWAMQQQLPYLSLNCSLEAKDRYTKGGFVILPQTQGGGMVYVLGKIANAVLIANITGSAMLVLEELNALPPEQQKNLNSLTDFRREIEIPELGWNLALQDDASLLVGATMNTMGGGIFDLNEDLLSRFVSIDVDYPAPEAEMGMLRELAPAGMQLDNASLDALVRIAQQTRQDTTSYSLSTRDLVQLLVAAYRVGWHDALFLAGQKFSPDDRKLVLERISDITTLLVPPNARVRSQKLAPAPQSPQPVDPTALARGSS